MVLQFKSFFYRCFDGDNPLAGLSGHAYECAQMKTLYELVGPFDASAAKHLICIDELGKGTEDTSATALCCAALQLFDQVRAAVCSALSRPAPVKERTRLVLVYIVCLTGVLALIQHQGVAMFSAWVDSMIGLV